MNKNITTLTDSYKIGHHNMYPEGTEKVYSYFESRKGARFNNTVFFGLQYLLKEYLAGKVVTSEKIAEGLSLINVHLGEGAYNLKGWEHVLNEHDGKLPLLIRAVPEGTPVPTNNVLMTVENTDPKCHWLTNHLETLLTHVWSASTVASLSREVKILCAYYLKQTTENMGGLPFMLHDFGFRGVSSVESAGFEGAGHLINFMGTDTIRAIEYAMDYYNSEVCAFSVPATEHSVMTSLGELGENELLGNLLDKYPTGILSLVIDSYNYQEFITEIAGQRPNKTKILNRDGVIVFRPDSGDPVNVTLDVLERLASTFGVQLNSKKFKVLNPKVKVLWGDGIDYYGIRNILRAMMDAGWSAENIVFGMGGGLLQQINRDTQRFAFKCSSQYRDGKWIDIWKKPLDVSKASKKGRLNLYRGDEFPTGFITTTKTLPDKENLLVPIFKDGELLVDYTFEQIRANAAIE